jgi:hypothetical protein
LSTTKAQHWPVNNLKLLIENRLHSLRHAGSNTVN